jgi:hypothetical protein
VTPLRHDPKYAERTRLRKLRVLRIHVMDAIRATDGAQMPSAHQALTGVLRDIEAEIASAEATS